MLIRTYQPGDEQAQARIYNAVAGSLPAFKPADPDEIVRRYQGDDADPGRASMPIVDDEVVGYAVFCANGRISYPWCLPGSEAVREPLLDAVLGEMARRAMPEAWAAYRADWSAVLDFFKAHALPREASDDQLPAEVSWMPDRLELPDDRITPAARTRRGRPARWRWRRDCSPRWSRIRSRPSSGTIRITTSPRASSRSSNGRRGKVLGASLLVTSDRFADPSKVDAAMPCFRLGRLRHRARAAQAGQRPVLLRLPRRGRRRVAALGARLVAGSPGRPDPCRRPGAVGFARASAPSTIAISSGKGPSPSWHATSHDRGRIGRGHRSCRPRYGNCRAIAIDIPARQALCAACRPPRDVPSAPSTPGGFHGRRQANHPRRAGSMDP